MVIPNTNKSFFPNFIRGLSMSELMDRIKEELCKEGICFRPEDELEIVAESWDEYLNYVRDLINDICPCALELMDELVVEGVARGMLGDTVFCAEVDGTEYYVRLR